MSDFGDLLAGVVACFVFLAVGRLLVPITQSHSKTQRLQLRMFTLAMLVRFVLSAAIYQFGLVSVLGDDDATGWGYGAWLQATWHASGFSIIDVVLAWKGALEFASGDFGPSTHAGYYYLVGTLFYLIGGPSRIVAAALNCFIGALTVVFAYRTARCLFSEAVAIRVGWWTCFFPSMIIWCAQTVKEPVVILLEVIALYACIQLKRSGFALRHVLLCGFAVAAVTPFRFYAAYIGATAVATALLVPLMSARSFRRGSALGFVMFVATLAVVSLVLARAEVRVERFDVEFIQQFRHDLAEGAGSRASMQFDMQTTSGFSLGTLVGAAHLLLAPFPWQLGGSSVRMLLTLPELIYWWWLVFFGVIPGTRFLCRQRFNDVAPVLVFVLGLGLLYSMTFGNVGLVFRQRAQLLPWLFMFAAVGLERRTLAARSRLAFQHHPIDARARPSMIRPMDHA